MSQYTNEDKLIEELLSVVTYAEVDLRGLAKGTSSDRVTETLKEIERVKELAHSYRKRNRVLDRIYDLKSPE
tara:strand:+ start:880 stop:1095 length:216 start_codon:yes stop_codon:yes gene_type:complete